MRHVARRRRYRARVLAGLALFALTGCNVILGIHEPSDQVLDAGGGGAGAPASPTALLRAAWPMPNPAASGTNHPQSYRAEGGAVTNRVTQLVWQQAVDEQTFTQPEAAAYCDALELAGMRFRLPFRIELLSLVDFTNPSPAIDAEAFPGTPADPFWTDSRLVGAGSTVWLVDFGASTGYSSSSDVGLQNRVRCVAGGGGVAGRLESRPDSVLDTGTVLEWQRAATAQLQAFAEAREYCAALELLGGGFRLPTLKELHTLVDETRADPAIDRDAFPDAQTADHWTSSPVAGAEGQVWTVNFQFGFDRAQAADSLQRVRCVR